MKAYCLWCERNPNSTEANPKTGLAWIHLSCFFKFYHTSNMIEEVKKRLDEGRSYEDIAHFIKRMENHEQRLNGILKMIYGENMPLIESR